MARERCRNCVYLWRDSSGNWRCRRYPPFIADTSRSQPMYTDFPRVELGWWCGEWAEKQE